MNENQPALLRKNQVDRIRVLAEQALASVRADNHGKTTAYWDLVGALGEIIKVCDGGKGADLAARDNVEEA
jgi:hypothetical protein